MAAGAGEFKIDDTSGVPVWMQVRKRFVYLITSGRYAPGDKLPTVRELAADLGINYNTVSKAYQDLARDGYVTNIRGYGMTVAEQPAGSPAPQDAGVVALADALIEEAMASGMCPNDVVALLRDRLEHLTA